LGTEERSAGAGADDRNATKAVARKPTGTDECNGDILITRDQAAEVTGGAFVPE
jgi:hypothetical protein